MKEIAIDVNGLTKSFGERTVVRDLSLKVPKGEIYGFLGPNGSGKTTTLRMLCGLLTPDSGEGTCLGYDIRTEADAIKRNVGYMTQRFSLYADLSIRENLEFVARVYGVPRPQGRGVARHRAARAYGPAGPARGRIVGRMEAAACARRLHPARAALAPSRRADRRRRSQGAARILGRDSWPRRRGHHRARLHPLHGRGRALPRACLYRFRRTVGARDGKRGRRAIGLEHLDRLRRRSAPARRRASRPATASTWWRRSARSCTSRAATSAALDAAIKAAKKQDGAHHWMRGEPSLEDVFILLMNNAKDNFA